MPRACEPVQKSAVPVALLTPEGLLRWAALGAWALPAWRPLPGMLRGALCPCFSSASSWKLDASLPPADEAADSLSPAWLPSLFWELTGFRPSLSAADSALVCFSSPGAPLSLLASGTCPSCKLPCSC